jgi:type IV pilus assembly protein PilY1
MGGEKTPGSSYAVLAIGTTGRPTATSPITQNTLQQQTVTSTTTATGSTSILGYRTVSENIVCLVGMTCATVDSNGNTVSASGTMFGWYLSLPGYTGVPWVGGSNQTEQVVYSPIESEGAFIVNTTIPANNSPLTCNVTAAAGWTMALNPATGGGFTNSFFADTNGNVISGSVSGVALNAVGSPSVVTAKGKPYLVNQTVTGVGTVNQISPPGGQNGQRLTWLQLH